MSLMKVAWYDKSRKKYAFGVTLEHLRFHWKLRGAPRGLPHINRIKKFCNSFKARFTVWPQGNYWQCLSATRTKILSTTLASTVPGKKKPSYVYAVPQLGYTQEGYTFYSIVNSHLVSTLVSWIIVLLFFGKKSNLHALIWTFFT